METVPETYMAVRVAAEQLAINASRDTWSLADAVLAHIPASGHGGKRQGGGTPTLTERLAELADQLGQDQVRNSNGNTWTGPELDALRNTAMAWPPADRLPACSFSTHREALGAERQAALRTLVAYADGQAVDVPERLRDRIDVRKVRGARYLVTVDDMRTLMGNQPTRREGPAEQPATAAQVAEVLRERPEVLAEAMAEFTPSEAEEVVIKVATSRPVSPEPEHHATKAEARERKKAGPTEAELEVAQARLVGEACKALQAVVDAFVASPPHPDAMAMRAMVLLRDLFGQVLVALDGPDALDAELRTLLADGQP